MPEAPTDGKIYGRKSAGWQNVFLDGVKIPTGKTLAFDQTSGAIVVNEGGGGSYTAFSLGSIAYVEADSFSVTAQAPPLPNSASPTAPVSTARASSMNVATQRADARHLRRWWRRAALRVQLQDRWRLLRRRQKLVPTQPATASSMRGRTAPGAKSLVPCGEAPTDGKFYARKDGAWVEIVAPSGLWSTEAGSAATPF